MPKKKSKPVTLLQIINEPRDKRTQKSVKRVAVSLFDNFRASEIANTDAFNGLSYQKIGAIKKKIASGKLYSPELRELLNQASQELQEKQEIYIKENEVEESKEGVLIFKNDKALNDYQKKQGKSWEIASSMKPNLKQAKTWHRDAGNGAMYFAILKRNWRGREVFFIVDIDPNRASRNTKRGSKTINEYYTKRGKQLWENFKKETTPFNTKKRTK